MISEEHEIFCSKICDNSLSFIEIECNTFPIVIREVVVYEQRVLGEW